MNYIFELRKNSGLNLRSGIQFQKFVIHTVRIGTESTVFVGAKIWDLISANIKSSKSVHIFESKIK